MRRKHDYMILHVDLFVRSMETALRFYNGALGFTIVEDTVISGPFVQSSCEGHYDALRIVILKSSKIGATLELQEFQPGSARSADASEFPLRRGWVSLLVRDLRALVHDLKGQNIQPVSDIFAVKLEQTRSCEVVFFDDPDGNRLEFLQIQA